MLLLQPSGEGGGVDGGRSGSGGDERRDSTEPFPALSETRAIAARARGVLELGEKGDAGTRGADTLGASVADARKKVLAVEGKPLLSRCFPPCFRVLFWLLLRPYGIPLINPAVSGTLLWFGCVAAPWRRLEPLSRCFVLVTFEALQRCRKPLLSRYIVLVALRQYGVSVSPCYPAAFFFVALRLYALP